MIYTVTVYAYNDEDEINLEFKTLEEAKEAYDSIELDEEIQYMKDLTEINQFRTDHRCKTLFEETDSYM